MTETVVHFHIQQLNTVLKKMSLLLLNSLRFTIKVNKDTNSVNTEVSSLIKMVEMINVS